MRARKLLLGTSLISYGLLSGWVGSAAATGPRAELALRQLQTDFHAAITLGDYNLMKSLWAQNSVFSYPGGTMSGPTAIADFFAASPGWGKEVSLTASYKSSFDVLDVLGTALFEYECIAVNVSGLAPLTTPLSSLPPGSQNPAVEIVAHLNASGTAVMENGAWVFEKYNGGGGPILP